MSIKFATRAYYAAEQAKFAVESTMRLSPDQARLVVGMLCEKFNTPRLPVVIRSGGRCSFYARGRMIPRSFRGDFYAFGPIIRILPQMLQIRTVCHEWAHHAHAVDEKRRGVKGEPGHSFQHKYWTEKAIGFIQTTDLYKEVARTSVQKGTEAIIGRLTLLKGSVPAPTTIAYRATYRRAAETAPVTEVVAPVPAAVDVVAAAFEALPAVCNCPKCHKDLPRAQFGMRVMTRDAAGVPTKVIRQSYCRTCR